MDEELEPEPHARGPWARALRRLARNRLALAALALLVVIFAAGALAAQIAPYPPDELHLDAISKPPSLSGPYYFGTDQVGHDVFSRVLYGIRTSVEVALSVAVLATLLGLLIGALAGYHGGWLDATLMRGVDFFVTIPALVAAFVAIVYVGHPSPFKIGLILTLILWTSVARVVRATFTSLREREYVEAAHAAGASTPRVIAQHLIPNAAGAIVVAATSLIGASILIEATVEFFSYGFSTASTQSLGNLVADATKEGLQGTPWWLYTAPAAVIVTMLVCVNFFGDSLEEAFSAS